MGYEKIYLIYSIITVIIFIICSYIRFLSNDFSFKFIVLKIDLKRNLLGRTCIYEL